MKFTNRKRKYFKRDSYHPINEKINKKNIIILFVKSGKSTPYDTLEASVIKSFKKEIQHFHTVSPNQHIHKVASEINPHLIIFFDGWNVPTTKVILLKTLGFKTAIWFLDDPYYTDFTKTLAPNYDYVFTVEKECIDFYKSLGCENVYFLPLAVDHDIFNQKKDLESKYNTNILFVGHAHPDRLQFLKSIDDELFKRNIRIIGPNWNQLKNSSLRDCILINDRISYEETARYYNGTKIVINMHRSIENPEINSNTIKIPALSLNPRTFEISACGAFQLTDYREELKNIYIPGKDIATYTSPSDLIKKIDYYLSHPVKRQRMARKAMQITLKSETFLNRINQLLQNVFTSINEKNK
ncbi:CgeB family protein [Chengkuizengella sediminis]|uniref:CgeB family protein n=1 Tax=Chengkuizengella sediminis TaxID=1885917 RepID=UPI00138A02EF|nr:glycosyltransferase [Chengkuizengella sediminis]NDI36224.1 glycosyltransferase [Chengkuizengella sediminis]